MLHVLINTTRKYAKKYIPRDTREIRNIQKMYQEILQKYIPIKVRENNVNSFIEVCGAI